ncbi:extracellular serine rich protein [Aspergillus candidus]|uniref:Extracellular membrane protein CFEM domain-containing protein n=1 Tax=Aspergillus candidus TaxID=41067 RepID=A0A2I2FCX2_ASPCN|nr:hypothetical protein BDW47DRAFT_125318 [Aspergillus candidus]PLB38481.1 hypothetical protein BDW47DRAFT_125318 [Aspergillus candidus]
MRATASIAVLTAGLASLAASQSFDNYDRCADAVFNDPNLGTCASNPGTSGLACFCTSDITGYDLTDATIALCARNHFPVESLKSLICNPNTQISTSDRKHSSSPMVRIANDAHQARALPEPTTATDTDTSADTETPQENAHSVIYQVITVTSASCDCQSTPGPATATAAAAAVKPSHAYSGVSPQHGSAAAQSSSASDILVHATPSTSATGASGSEKVVATSSAIMPSGTDSSDGEGEQHGILFQGGAERGVRSSVGAVLGGLVVGVLGVVV